MKNFLLYIICSFSFGAIYAQAGKPGHDFTIYGEFTGRDTKALTISYFDENAIWTEDTTKIENGKFEFRGSITEPTRVTIQGNTKSRAVDDPNMTEFFIEPGITTIALTEHDFKNVVIEGSRSQEILEELKLLKKTIEASSKPVKKAYGQIKDSYAKGDTSKTVLRKMESLRRELIPFQDSIKAIDLHFVETHNNTFISSYILGYYAGRISGDSLEYYYSMLSDAVKNNKYGRQIQKSLIPDDKPTAVAGSVAPEILMRDIHDKWVSLKSFQSKKYVLLDFWASWCIPCVRMNPYLKKMYETYKDEGLEIVSLSLDHSKIAWENAIQKEKLDSWLHILVGPRGETFDHISHQYDLTTIPMYILVDRQGVIVGRYNVIEQNSPLVKKLSEIFSSPISVDKKQ
ncbi:TlpA disulfide reductase family protein [Sinomicrobium oceani]|nr:TlpA disulfide reductase family protein [Sinomicrobium oceani]